MPWMPGMTPASHLEPPQGCGRPQDVHQQYILEDLNSLRGGHVTTMRDIAQLAPREFFSKDPAGGSTASGPAPAAAAAPGSGAAAITMPVVSPQILAHRAAYDKMLALIMSGARGYGNSPGIKLSNQTASATHQWLYIKPWQTSFQQADMFYLCPALDLDSLRPSLSRTNLRPGLDMAMAMAIADGSRATDCNNTIDGTPNSLCQQER